MRRRSEEVRSLVATRTVRVGLWSVTVAGSVGLVYFRYHHLQNYIPNRNANIGDDFWVFFEAAKAVASGHSPYLTSFGHLGNLYVYSPLVAILLVPFIHVAIATAWHWWILASIGSMLAAGALVMKAEGSSHRDWRTPVLLGVIAASSLRFLPTEIVLENGNTDTFVLAILAASVLASERGRSTASGALLALSGVVKSWPWAAALILLRRHYSGRGRSVVTFISVSLLAPFLALLLGGPSELAGYLRATLRASSQPLISCSVWGAPQALFSRSGLARPLLVSTPLRMIATLVFLCWVVGVLALCLRSSSSTRLSLWNVVGCVVLLLPVSHADYTIYVLPILWIWVARALTKNRFFSRESLVTGLLVLWWFSLFPSAFFTWLTSAPALSVEVPFIANLMAVTISVVGDLLLTGDRPLSGGLQLA